jgi:hypothetical protein
VSWGIPDQYDEVQAEEDRRWNSRYAEGRTVRTPLGRHLSDMAAQEFASDPRYLMFADYVSPIGWQVAAQQRSLTLGRVMNRLFDAGPDPVLIARVGMTVEQWRAKVLQCYEAALKDERTEAEDFDVRWHATGGRPYNDPYDPNVIDAPKGRPAGLEGYKHTEGRQDRPSRIARKRRGHVGSRLGRRTTPE